MNNNQTLILEIIGPSGSGKSTLSKMLRKEDGEIVAGVGIWGLPAAQLTLSAIAAMPDGMRLRLKEKTFRKEEFKQMIRLDALYKCVIANKFIDENTKALMLDEGPVFAISKLRTDRQDYHCLFENWEERALDRWAPMLGTIVWLDAEDDILIGRMRKRAKRHRMKSSSNEEIYGFLSRYRNAFEKVINGLRQRSNIQILRFDSASNSLEDIADELTRYCANIESSKDLKILNKNTEYIYGKATY